MKHSPQSITTAPQSPADESRARMRNYAITMSVRMVCFGLAVMVTPYSWYTWVFAFGAIFLPYFAVVIANATRPSRGDQATAPTIALNTKSPEATTQRDVQVITIPEANQ